MKPFGIAVLAVALVLGATVESRAHIGEKIYLVFEIPDDDLADIDLFDASVADWEEIVGDASLNATDFFADPTVGEGAQYDPADLDYQIWLGWNNSTNLLYLAIERIDNVYINEYAGGNPGAVWNNDSLEFMVDADHSGGQYNFNGDDTMTAEDIALIFNRGAQKWNAIYDTPDNRYLGYPGSAVWANAAPYSDGGGGSIGSGPTTSVLEIYVTPFEDLIWSDESATTIVDLEPGKVIGFQIAVPDFDTAPGEYRAYHTLSGQAATFRFSERFVDGRLVGAGGATAVADQSWARIKASLVE